MPRPVKKGKADAARLFSLAINNPDDAPREYHVSVKLPSSLRWAKEPSSWSVQVPAGEEQEIGGIVEAGSVEHPTEAELCVKVNSPGMVERRLSDVFMVFPKRVISFRSSVPEIDGRLNDWRGQKTFVSVEEPGLLVQTWLGWDTQHLYLAVKVRGSFTPQPPPAIPAFWKADSIELFLDMGNQKHIQYDEDDIQLFFIPVFGGSNQSLGGRVVRQQRGDNIEVVDSVIDTRLRTAASSGDNGYLLEAAIPWSALGSNLRPEQGFRLGLNLALNHPATEDSSGYMNSLMGLEAKFHNNPSKWPTVILK